jgi:AcrR family transcriptional regulator
MGTQERREREREELREKILDAARDLFVTEGYERVTMRRIADKIEYSPTAIYLHFKDKTDLITELVNRENSVFSTHLRRIVRVEDPIERIRRMGRAYIEFGIAHPDHYRLLFLRPPLLLQYDSQVKADPQQDGYFLLTATVTEAIEARRLRPELKDPDLVAQTLWAGVHGVVALLLTHSHQKKKGDWGGWKKPKDLGQLMVDTLIRGLSAG